MIAFLIGMIIGEYEENKRIENEIKKMKKDEKNKCPGGQASKEKRK